MNIATWLSKLTDIVNLGKLLVDAGPGIILTVSLVVLFASTFHLPVLILEDQDWPRWCQPSPAPSNASSAKPDSGSLERARRVVDERQAAIATIEAEKAKLDAEITAFDDDLTRLKAEIELAQRDPIGERRRQGLKVQEERTRESAGKARRSRAEKERQLEASKRKVDEAYKQLEEMHGDRVVSAQGLLGFGLTQLAGLGMVGYLLGTIMSPINRFFFIDLVDKIAPAKRALLPYGASRFRTLREKAQKEFLPAEDTPFLAPTPPPNVNPEMEAYARPPAYFVGRGVISQDEWDFYVSGFYRWAEASVNMVIPLIALGYASAAVLCDVGGTGFLVAAGYVVGAVLVFIGRKRWVEYEKKLTEFIYGRLRKIHEEAEAAGTAKTLVDAIKEIKEALALAKQVLENRP